MILFEDNQKNGRNFLIKQNYDNMRSNEAFMDNANLERTEKFFVEKLHDLHALIDKLNLEKEQRLLTIDSKLTSLRNEFEWANTNLIDIIR